jgi:hypothetical protein
MDGDIRIITLEDSRAWIKEVSLDGLPCQSWGYAWGLQASGVNPKLAVVRSEGARMLLPFVERQWMGAIDIVTIPGPSGASVTPGSIAPLSLWREYAKSQGWVAGYIRLSPRFGINCSTQNDEIKEVKTAVLLDLEGPNILSISSRSIRTKIYQADRQGFELIDSKEVLAGVLACHYPEAMVRVGAHPLFQFSIESLYRWVNAPGSLVLGARLAGAIEAVCLFFVGNDYAEAHVMGTSEKGRPLLPWLISKGASRLRDRGVKTLDIGGGLQQGDGLSRFKERFGGIPSPIRAAHQIYDGDRYKALCSAAGLTHPTDWFPAYRAPAAV